LRFQTWYYVTNDVPGCPKGGVLTGTDGSDQPPERAGLDGKDGDDKIRGLGGSDEIYGSSGGDVIYGGPGRDFLFSGVLNGGLDEGNYDDVLYGGDDPDDLWAGNGEDALYGGDGNDRLDALEVGMGETAPRDAGRDKLFCGGGWDRYRADPNDYVDSSCEKGQIWENNKVVDTGGPPLIRLAGAVLLLSSGLLVLIRYVIHRA
jgi:Ca2+-binding RTX toxin-like protein